MESENRTTGETDIHGETGQQGQLRESQGQQTQHGPERTKGHDDGDETGRNVRLGEGELRGRSEHGDGHRSESEGATKKRELEESWYDLGFSINRSLRYHSKRRAFFERCNHWTRVLLAIFGATVIGTIFNEIHRLSVCIAVGIAILTVLDLVFDFSKRAMTYDTLCKKFADLKIRFTNTEMTWQHCRQITTERFLIEREEPSTLRVLDVICSNEERLARGFDGYYEISQGQRFFCYLFDCGSMKFKLVGAE